MTLQDQITALCAEAEPLRARHDGGGDELRELVEQINELRALESQGAQEAPEASKRRGRKPKEVNA